MADVQEKIREKLEQIPETLSALEITVNIMITLAIGGLVIVLFLYLAAKKIKSKVKPSTVGDKLGFKYRFRKRDKVMFYGRKIFRKVRSITKNTIKEVDPRRSTIRAKRKKLVSFAKKLLRKESSPQLVYKEPPPAFLEADWPEFHESDYRLPLEVLYMLKSVRVFGHFERPLFLELCKHMDSKFIHAGSFLFKVGDVDDSIYVVQNGNVNVFITEPDGSEHIVKEVCQGDSIQSLLSILDALTGHPAPYKTVSAVAVTDTTVLRLPAAAFATLFDRFPESLVRVVQIIMVRLQRVTFMALHNYLGLTHELINPHNLSDRTFSVHTIGAKQSPVKQYSKDSKDGSTEKVLNVVDYTTDDSFNARGIDIPVIDRIRENSKRVNYHHHRSKSEERTIAEASPSDFDAVIAQARLTEESNLGIQTGSPVHLPKKTSDEQINKNNRNPRKITSLPDQTYSSSAPLDSDGFKTYMDDNQIIELARMDLMKILGLDDEELLEGKLTLKYLRSGRALTKQGDQDASLVFVVTGTLQVLQQVVGNENEERTLFIAHPGEMVGSLAVLTGEPSFFTTRARTDVRIILISKNDFYGIMQERPRIVLNVAETVLRRMSPFVRQIDFALDWTQMEAGRALYRQGDHSDSIYIVLNGRLRSVVSLLSGKKELIGEYGRGELVGLVEILTQTDRSTTVMAVRDTELAMLPGELLNLIKRKYPQIVTRLIHLLGQRILGSLQDRNVSSALSEHPNVDLRPAVANLATVAILGASDDVPTSNFTLELQYALNTIGPTLRLTSEIIQNRLGVNALDTVNEYRLLSWLGQQEDIHRIVLYQCDQRMTAWTQRCIRQADCILIVGRSGNEPKESPLEKQVENMAVRAQKELVLLHKDESVKPTRTVEWLNARGYCNSHHHIKCPKRVFSKKSQAKMMEIYEKLYETPPDCHSDFSRLARFLTGTSVGLVLGGGGARGCAHVGLIRAMTELGIPIDMVGGTSIGSFMGGLWCAERNITTFTQKAREWSMEFGKIYKKVLDLTYPITSMFSGASLNHAVEDVFKHTQIEDLWLPYFCVTTDISSSKERIHTSGCLWRYCRASMSLAGYLPPLCDPTDGHLLLDGGYVNNLPADVMRARGAQTIFAIDVGAQDEANLTNYGDVLSGWWLLWKRWNPWASAVKVPSMDEVQSRLAYVSCAKQMEAVMNSGYCEYIRPPIDKYKTLQFGAFDEINEVGYNHGKTLFGALKDTSLIKDMFKEKSRDKIKPKCHQTQVPANAAFTDLAAMVSQIEEPQSAKFFISDIDEDDEYEDEEDEVSIATTIISSRTPKHKIVSQLSNASSKAESGVHKRARIGSGSGFKVEKRRTEKTEDSHKTKEA